MTNGDVEVAGVSDDTLIEYARIPIAFEVQVILDVAVDHRHNGFDWSEQPVETAYVKDYDAEAHAPTGWPAVFDTSRWGLMIARMGGRCVGGATVAYDTPELDMLEGRSDLAVLWDIRVHPRHRRQGVGAALFGAAEAWALEKDCRQLKVETQNVNVPACRFYARRGCVLGAVRPGVYLERPAEVQLLWYKDLAAGPASIAMEPSARN